MIIAVDFDGVINQAAYPALSLPHPDAVNYLREWQKRGYFIILWTCRTGDKLIEAINYMQLKGIPFNSVNDNCPQNKEQYSCNTRKIYADVYIDDKQVGGLPDWDTIDKYIQNIKQ